MKQIKWSTWSTKIHTGVKAPGNVSYLVGPKGRYKNLADNCGVLQVSSFPASSFQPLWEVGVTILKIFNNQQSWALTNQSTFLLQTPSSAMLVKLKLGYHPHFSGSGTVTLPQITEPVRKSWRWCPVTCRVKLS